MVPKLGPRQMEAFGEVQGNGERSIDVKPKGYKLGAVQNWSVCIYIPLFLN